MKRWLIGSIVIAQALIIIMLTVIVRQEPKENYDHYYMKNANTPIYQCDIPIYYGYSKDMSPRARAAIHKAIRYWNSIYEGKLFVYKNAGDWMPINGKKRGVVLIGVGKEKLLTLATTRYVPRGKCIRANIILSSATEGKANDETLESIFRHELGHTLGLSHRDESTSDDLMFGLTKVKSKVIKTLSVEEVKAFRYVYKR